MKSLSREKRKYVQRAYQNSFIQHRFTANLLCATWFYGASHADTWGKKPPGQRRRKALRQKSFGLTRQPGSERGVRKEENSGSEVRSEGHAKSYNHCKDSGICKDGKPLADLT